MSLEPTICEPMKTITHDQQSQASPSRTGVVKPIGVINLATKLANDPLDDVGSARHPWMIEMSEKKRELVLQGKAFLFQSTVLESLPSLLPDLKPEVPLGLGFDIEQPKGQSLESFDSFTRSLVEVAEVVMEKLPHVAHTELQRDSGEEPLAGTPKAPIPVNDKSFKGITDFVSEALKHGLPVVRFLAGSEAGDGDVLGGGISAEQQRVVLSLNEDSLSIEQEVATPRGFNLLCHLDEGFRVFSQGIDPLKEAVGTDMQLTAHGSVGSFSIKVQMSGTQDEAWGHSFRFRSVTRGRERTLALITPPASNLACPQPTLGANRNAVDGVPFSM